MAKKANKKKTRKPPVPSVPTSAMKGLKVIPFPKLLVRGIANATERYQAEIKAMVEEAAFDLQIKGDYRVDLGRRQFIEMSEVDKLAAAMPVPPPPEGSEDGPK